MWGVWLLACEQAQGRQGRGGNRNEGLHSALRGKLNSLARRTMGYSKTDGMLTLSIAPVFCDKLKLNTT